ncbi:hypothetical protein V6Z11_A09G084700 [Gossypium hirsutum]
MHNNFTSSTFKFVVDKVRKNLSGWDVRKILLLGRITLAKSMVLTIPNYFMSTICMLVSVCNKIERIAYNFIWGTCIESKKSSLLSWGACCLPIDNRGLGLRSLANQNRVFLLKLGFQLLTNMEALWV